MIGLLDSSGLIWIRRHPGTVSELDAHVVAGDVALCEPVTLEVLRGMESAAAYLAAEEALAGMPHVPVSPRAFQRARAIQRELAALPGPRHRSVAPTDLLVAAAAIEAELPLLHRDRDFEAIAAVTGQPQRWVGPRA